MEYDKGSHSVYLLYYHLILCIKYRRKVINTDIFKELKRILNRIALNYEVNIIEVNHDKDPIHILFKAKPTLNIPLFINVYKSCSSRIIQRTFPDIVFRLWKGNFWSSSYCLLTSGDATTETIKKYIERQGMK